MVPAQSAFVVHQMGSTEQHEHPGIGAALLARARGEESPVVSRKLLAEKQARRREGKERTRIRVGDSGRSAAKGGYGDGGERSSAAGPRNFARLCRFR